MILCKTCGGDVKRSGNFYICEYCANSWEIDSGNDIHAVDRANAWAALREGDFEKSTELFEHILAKENSNHEAYWGRALALNGIVYVTDLNENRKVPTCNNITEESFIAHKDVQKAISLAPANIADSYRQQAEYIEKVRTEWLEKASKEPAYDVFISFKDSDRENGIVRTQDSIDAQDLYNALIAEGYKVFFSRISLRDKISEQYEPYIYNAINTAKVMIVFGEKPEYFSSVWIKNEWSRFRARIEKGEKHRNSLVVVYKNMSPAELPAVLKARQCMNAGDMTFLSDLTRHIKRVVNESQRIVHLEKITIEGGKIARKAASLSINAVKIRQIGEGAVAETSITEKQSVSLLHTYLELSQWQEALTLADDVLFNNPNCAEAIWCMLLAQNKVPSGKALVKKLEKLSDGDFAYIEKVLNTASQSFAEEILTLLYQSEKELSDRGYERVLTTILPYSFQKRQSMIRDAFEGVIARHKLYSFQLLLNTLDNSDVDQYISYNCKYARAIEKWEDKYRFFQKILDVDPGHVEALRGIVSCDLEKGAAVGQLTADFEALLKYTPDMGAEVVFCLDWLSKNIGGKSSVKKTNYCAFAKQLIRYYPGAISALKDNLIRLSYQMIEANCPLAAEYYLNLVLSFDANNADVYWAICLLKLHVQNESQIHNADILLREVPEFNKYLTLVSEDRKKKCISLSIKQKQCQEQQIREKMDKVSKEIADLHAKAGSLKTVWPWKELLVNIGLLAVTVVLTIAACGLFAYIEFHMLMLAAAFAGCFFMWVFGSTIKEIPSPAVCRQNKKEIEKLQERIRELEAKKEEIGKGLKALESN